MSARQIERLKNQLTNGVSQEEAEQIRQQILSLGGKVNLTNFGYSTSSLNQAQQPTTNPPAPGEAPGTTAPTSNDVVAKTDEITRKDPASAVDAEMAAEDFNANKTIAYNNPNTYTPFGSSEVTRDENGNLVYNQKLSDAQQGILDQQQGLTSTATGFVGNRLGGFSSDFNPNLSQRAMQGDLIAERGRIEDELYGRLSKNLERDRGRELEAKEQDLYNKGIPFSDDPESRYQKEIRGIQDRYDSQAQDYRGQAVAQGGDEFLRQFGAQEQLRANQLSEQAGIRGTNLSELGTLQGYGSGLMLPNLPGYQGPGAYNPMSPFETWLGMQGNLQNWQGVKQGQQQVDIAQSAANRPPSGGGGGAPAPSGPPIVAPPGL